MGILLAWEILLFDVKRFVSFHGFQWGEPSSEAFSFFSRPKAYLKLQPTAIRKALAVCKVHLRADLADKQFPSFGDGDELELSRRVWQAEVFLNLLRRHSPCGLQIRVYGPARVFRATLNRKSTKEGKIPSFVCAYAQSLMG